MPSVAPRRGLLAAIALLLVTAPNALAAPDITLDKDAPAAVLYGEDSQVTLRAANPPGQPYGYNLSFRDVLPAGVSYVPGSSTVAPRIIANAPAAGQTTLIFENVSDLSPGATHELEYRVRHSQATFTAGGQYTNSLRGGKDFRFTLTIRMGKGGPAGVGITVCDQLPRGLVFVRAPGASFRRGQACWSFRYVRPGATKRVNIIARGERGYSTKRVCNVGTLGAGNTRRSSGKACVRVMRAFGGRAGGVTG